MEKLSEILGAFNIPEGKYHFQTISNGLINDTNLVLYGDEPVYILQRINTAVFTNFKALMHNIEAVLPRLDAPGYKKVELLHTRKGMPYHTDGSGEIWRMMTYIKGSKVYNTTNDEHVAFEAGRIIALFHKLLENADVSRLQITLPDFHNLEFRYGQFKEALAQADSEKISTAGDAIAFVDQNIDKLLGITFDTLPVRVCHNDTKLNNILFTSGDKALCLIDLDTLMPGTFLYDFGDAVRTLVNPAPEDEIDLDKIKFDVTLFDAFAKGLGTQSDLFSETEKKQMPLGAALMPFLHGIRALTDYLENNRYYKVQYENQNLDRSRSLFRFSQLAFDAQEGMSKSLAKYL